MTTKTLSTYIAAGYELQSKYSELLITASGGVGGYGVAAFSLATISNFGRINASGDNTGISLIAGGAVVNQESGYIGGEVYAGAAASVTNNGRIAVSGGHPVIYLRKGGSITNGSYADPGAKVSGGDVIVGGAAGTVANLGTILGAVSVNKGGRVTNGGANDTAALIEGPRGVGMFGIAGTVANFGTIQGYTYQGAYLTAGGALTNGSATDTAATISGVTGVALYAAGTVTNYGAIRGTGAAHGDYGVQLDHGGRLTNGIATHPGALIEGYTAVSVGGAAGTVVNLGTLQGDGAAAGESGVYLGAGGRLANGSSGDHGALIEGAAGVVLAAAGTVANAGRIIGVTAYGVQLRAGGALTNGSLNNRAALIEGYTGLGVAGTATATNFGTILGTGDVGGAGAVVLGGVNLINGAAGDTTALIEGFEGVLAYKTGNTVTNFGTIAGGDGTAVRLTSSTDVLVVEAGCAFIGAVSGGGGATLDLDTGAGTLTGLLAGGDVTVSGSMAATTFSNFATVEIGAAASFASSGAVTIAAGQGVIDAGTLTLGGAKTTVVNAGLIEADGGSLTINGAAKNTGTLAVVGGNLTVNGAVTGGGSATIKGGTLDLAASFTQNVAFTGNAGALELGKSQGYAGTVTGFSKTGGTSLDLDDIAFVGSGEATFAGTKSGGVLTVTDGTHTAHINLAGDYRTSTFIAASDGHGGVIVHDPAKAPAVASPHPLIAAMARLGATGAGPLAGPPATWRAEAPGLAKPRAAIA